MTNRKILEKAIQKAIDGGWRPTRLKSLNEVWKILDWYDGSVNDIIFNHDFAKALWGEEIVILKVAPLPDYPKIAKKGEKGRDLMHRWQYHLQQMVISDDPIKYLGENL